MDVLLPVFEKLMSLLLTRQGSTSLHELVYLYAIKALGGQVHYEDPNLRIVLEPDSTLSIYSKNKVDVPFPFQDTVERRVFCSRESLILFCPGHWTSYLLNNCSWDYDPTVSCSSSISKKEI